MIQKIKELWISYKSSVPAVTAVVLVFGLIVVTTQQSIAQGRSADRSAGFSSGYHGLGWKNFGYLKPGANDVTSERQRSKKWSRRFGRDITKYEFGRSGRSSYRLSDVFAGGGSGSGKFGGGGSDQKRAVQLALLNQTDIGTDVLTSSGTTETTGGQEGFRRPDQNDEFAGQAHAVPEPATMLLFGSGAVAMAFRRRKNY